MEGGWGKRRDRHYVSQIVTHSSSCNGDSQKDKTGEVIGKNEVADV